MRAIVESPMKALKSEDPDLVHVLGLYFESPIKEGIVDWRSQDVR